MNDLSMLMLGLSGGGGGSEGPFTINETGITGMDDTSNLEIFSFYDDLGQPRSFIKSSNYLMVKGVKNTDLTNNSLKIADINKRGSFTGTQNGFARYKKDNQEIFTPIMFRFSSQEIFAHFLDISFLSNSGIDLYFYISGVMHGDIY